MGTKKLERGGEGGGGGGYKDIHLRTVDASYWRGTAPATLFTEMGGQRPFFTPRSAKNAGRSTPWNRAAVTMLSFEQRGGGGWVSGSKRVVV